MAANVRLGRAFIDFIARDSKLVAGVRRAGTSLRRHRSAVRDVRNAYRSVTNASRDFRRSLLGANGALLATIGIAGGVVGLVSGFVRLSDQALLFAARLKLVAKDTADFKSAFSGIVEIAREIKVPFGSLVDLTQRIARSFGGGATEVLSFVKGLSQAGIISGSTSQEIKNGLIQLAQGIASNRLGGDELRAVFEQLPRIAQAIAAGLGVTIGQVRELAEQGVLTKDLIRRAISSQLDVINEEYGQLPITVGRALTGINNEIELLVARVSSSSGITSRIVSSLDGLQKVIGSERVFDALLNGVDLLTKGLTLLLANLDLVGNALQFVFIRSIAGSRLGTLVKSVLTLGLSFQSFAATYRGAVRVVQSSNRIYTGTGNTLNALGASIVSTGQKFYSWLNPLKVVRNSLATTIRIQRNSLRRYVAEQKTVISSSVRELAKAEALRRRNAAVSSGLSGEGLVLRQVTALNVRLRAQITATSQAIRSATLTVQASISRQLVAFRRYSQGVSVAMQRVGAVVSAVAPAIGIALRVGIGGGAIAAAVAIRGLTVAFRALSRVFRLVSGIALVEGLIFAIQFFRNLSKEAEKAGVTVGSFFGAEGATLLFKSLEVQALNFLINVLPGILDVFKEGFFALWDAVVADFESKLKGISFTDILPAGLARPIEAIFGDEGDAEKAGQEIGTSYLKGIRKRAFIASRELERLGSSVIGQAATNALTKTKDEFTSLVSSFDDDPGPSATSTVAGEIATKKELLETEKLLVAQRTKGADRVTQVSKRVIAGGREELRQIRNRTALLGANQRQALLFRFEQRTLAPILKAEDDVREEINGKARQLLVYQAELSKLEAQGSDANPLRVQTYKTLTEEVRKQLAQLEAEQVLLRSNNDVLREKAAISKEFATEVDSFLAAQADQKETQGAIRITKGLVQESLTPLQQYKIEMEAIAKASLAAGSGITAAGSAAATTQAQINLIKSGGTLVRSALNDAASGAKSLGEAAGGSFGNIAEKIGEVLDLVSKLSQLFNTLSVLLTQLGGGGGGGGLSSFFSFLGSFGGARRHGGPVTAGRSYIVGEEGPEPFVPKSSGYIIPAGAYGNAGGGNFLPDFQLSRSSGSCSADYGNATACL